MTRTAETLEALRLLSESSKGKALELFILSALSLFVELLVIRWMSADIRAFTVFRTFPLVTCFVGLGVGFSLGRSNSYKLLPLAILTFAVFMKAADLLGLGVLSFPSLAVFQWQNLTGLVGISASYVAMFLLAIVIVLGIPFGMCVSIASRMGVLFSELRPLPAYCWNILGSLMGGVLFTCLSNTRMAPWQLLLIPLAVTVVLQWKGIRKSAVAGIVALVVIPVLFLGVPSFPAKPLIPALLDYHASKSTTLWSPYQRIDLTVLESSPSEGKRESEFVGLELSANRAFYQYYFNLKSDSPLSKQSLWQTVRHDYALAFSFNNPQSALIVGSGTGQNVSSAVEFGVKDVDAVEIDPVIIDIGKRYNPSNNLPSVRLTCDDARHFFAQCKRKYDVVNFSTLDSHTIAGLGSSVRIDAYVYTRESIRQALGLLNDKGVLVISFSTVAPWTEARLFKTFAAAAGYEPIVIKGTITSCIFVLGPSVKDGSIQIPPGYERLTNTYPNAVRILTDDWPYLYVQPESIDYPYLLVVLEIIALSLFAGRRTLIGKSDPIAWQLFFLGAAFMLLELHAISFLSLLYGSTWITSALVINGILVMILAATLVTDKLIPVGKNVSAAYFLLFLSIAVSFLVSSEGIVNAMASGHQAVLYGAVTVVTLLPMGIAGIVFASGLRHATNTARGLAFNLFGAVVGGLLEYVSIYVGIRKLLLVAILLYLCSFMAYRLALKHKRI